MDILNIFENQINLIVVSMIGVLALIDLIFDRDLKSQIVSLGVLGTFIGIFIGLEDFDPNEMKSSINAILMGLKTAFFTSIVGMGTATLLSIIEKFSKKDIDNSGAEEKLLRDISNKLNSLDSNFNKMNGSLEIAIERLSKGGTEEMVEVLNRVIQWQESYKEHIENYEKSLKLSLTSIEKSKTILEVIASKSQEIEQRFNSIDSGVSSLLSNINRITKSYELNRREY